MKAGGLALFVVGGILVVSVFLWGRAGFYTSQVPVMLLLLAAGVGCIAIGAKLNKGKEPNKAVEWRPADAAPPVEQQVMPSSVDVVAPVAPATLPPPPPAVESVLDESTRVVPHRSRVTGWTLVDPAGIRHTITGGTLAGRDPVLPSGGQHAIIRLPDADGSVSKTHALFEVDASGLTVTDLGSTNGTVVITSSGVETDCVGDQPVAVPAQGTVELGTYALAVEGPAVTMESAT